MICVAGCASSFNRARMIGFAKRRGAQRASSAPLRCEGRTIPTSKLERELQALNDRDVQLLLMRHRFGWTLKRIGDALGLKPGAVDGRIRRVLTKLRRRAKEQSHD